MLRFLANFYRLDPKTCKFIYDGAQLRRPQKWGKDPFGAAILIAEAVGPTLPDGWDAAGDPVGRPRATPYIPCLGTSEENTANTYTPVLSMIQNGPLNDVAGMDAGKTRVLTPGGGKIEPVTASARARLGARMTFLTITEGHLFTANGGYRKLASAVKRNAAGMDARWIDLTNGYDPTEMSEAQVEAEEALTDPSIYIDATSSIRVPELSRAYVKELRAELIRQYGDSADVNGGWVNIDRMVRECLKESHAEADRRRFFLNEIVWGESRLVSPIAWKDAADETDPLRAGDMVALGFDGSRKRDATALVACRIRDGKLFLLKAWERPEGVEDWDVPRKEVDEEVDETFELYDVRLVLADPYLWQDYLDRWSESHPDAIVEFPTNVEMKMDKAIERFLEAMADKSGGIKHSNSEVLNRHVLSTILIKGSRKKARPGQEDSLAVNYQKLAKGTFSSKIDACVAAILARHARGIAIEKGLAKEEEESPLPLMVWR